MMVFVLGRVMGEATPDGFPNGVDSRRRIASGIPLLGSVEAGDTEDP